MPQHARRLRVRRPWIEFERCEERSLLSAVIPAPDPSLFNAPVPTDAPVVGPDGGLWFVEPDRAGNPGNVIARVGVDGKFAQYPLPAGRFVQASGGLTLGPDGALWFEETRAGGRDAIGRMTTAGVLTEFALPNGQSLHQSGGLVVGGDGNLWFLENGAVGRITTSGAISAYPVPHDRPATRIYGLIAGSDGRLDFLVRWLDGADHLGAIERLDPFDGTLTEYPLASNAPPDRLIAGSDGSVYTVFFTEVFRLDANGGVTAFAWRFPSVVPDYPFITTAPAAYDVTTGPDGRLWVLMYNFSGPNHIDVVSYDGPTPVLGPAGLYEIPYIAGFTNGPDGRAWFATNANWSQYTYWSGPATFGAVSADGTVTKYPTTVPGTVFNAPTVGPDGALWYTELPTATQHAALVRVSTDGKVQQFVAPDLPAPPAPRIPPAPNTIGGGPVSPPQKVALQSVARTLGAVQLVFNTTPPASIATSFALLPAGPRGRVAPHARPIVVSAVVNAATHSVTLSPARRLPWNGFYRLNLPAGLGAGSILIHGAGWRRV